MICAFQGRQIPCLIDVHGLYSNGLCILAQTYPRSKRSTWAIAMIDAFQGRQGPDLYDLHGR